MKSLLAFAVLLTVTTTSFAASSCGKVAGESEYWIQMGGSVKYAEKAIQVCMAEAAKKNDKITLAMFKAAEAGCQRLEDQSSGAGVKFCLFKAALLSADMMNSF